MLLRIADERLAELMIRFLREARAYGLSGHTVTTYRGDLALFYDFMVEKGGFPQHYAHTTERQWHEYLSTHNTRKTHASQVRAIHTAQAFLRFLVATNVLEEQQVFFLGEEKSLADPLEKKVKKIKKTHPLLAHEDFLKITTLLKKKSFLGDEKATRDWVLVELLGGCGLKASEVANLTWGQVGEATLILRNIPLTADGVQALKLLSHVRTRGNLGIEKNSCVLFGYTNVSRAEKHEPMDRHGIKFVVSELTYEVLGRTYRPEDVRQQALRFWQGQGVAWEQIQRWGGYGSVASLKQVLGSGKKVKVG